MQSHIGIIGGGIAGSTTAIELSKKGYRVTLLESGPSLVNGPPICHLHAGGNLYRELPDQACLKLLEQSIATLRCYKYAINFRPTIIATPNRDQGEVANLLPRLKKLQSHYQQLILEDPANKVLGEATEYFKVYTKSDLKRLAKLDTPNRPVTPDEWMISFAKSINIDDFKADFYLVQEYGVSLFRLSAGVQMTLEQSENCTVLTNAKVKGLVDVPNGWLMNVAVGENQKSIAVDYLVNAAGFRSGDIDDLVGVNCQRMAEIKAAYVVQWPQQQGIWPEVIFHGLRGTANGMASLTPYPNNHMQLHGMTDQVTLFKDGLTHSSENSSQPAIKKDHLKKVDVGWDQTEIKERTQSAINHIIDLIPTFTGAEPAGPPLFGIQQIPGTDASNRTADAAFSGEKYARVEIIKLSSALTAANKVARKLAALNYSVGEGNALTPLSYDDVKVRAEEVASERGFPASLARRVK